MANNEKRITITVKRYVLDIEQNEFENFKNTIYRLLKNEEEEIIYDKNDTFSLKNIQHLNDGLAISIERLENFNVPYVKECNGEESKRREIELGNKEYIVPKITNIIIRNSGKILCQTGKSTITMGRFNKLFLEKIFFQNQVEFEYEIIPEMNMESLESIADKEVKKILIHGKPEHFMNIFSFESTTDEKETNEATISYEVKVPKKNKFKITKFYETIKELKEKGNLTKCIVTCNEDDKFVEYFLSEVQEKDSFEIICPIGATIYETTIIEKMEKL